MKVFVWSGKKLIDVASRETIPRRKTTTRMQEGKSMSELEPTYSRLEVNWLAKVLECKGARKTWE